MPQCYISSQDYIQFLFGTLDSALDLHQASMLTDIKDLQNIQESRLYRGIIERRTWLPSSTILISSFWTRWVNWIEGMAQQISGKDYLGMLVDIMLDRHLSCIVILENSLRPLSSQKNPLRQRETFLLKLHAPQAKVRMVWTR